MTLEPSCGSQLTKRLSWLHINIPAALTGLYTMLGNLASREILGWIRTLTLIFCLQWNVDRNREVPPGASIFFIILFV